MPATLDKKFEKFLGGPTEAPEQRIYVSMSKRGLISLNAKCYRELGKPVAVFLHFSRVDDIIAIEPLDSTRFREAFPLKPNGTAWSISAAPFCRNFGIKLGGTERFISPEIRDGALQLKLSETVTITRTRRVRKKRPPAISPLDESQLLQII